jgi:hypothetical protein
MAFIKNNPIKLPLANQMLAPSKELAMLDGFYGNQNQ